MLACRRLQYSAFNLRTKPAGTELYAFCGNDENYTGLRTGRKDITQMKRNHLEVK